MKRILIFIFCISFLLLTVSCEAYYIKKNISDLKKLLPDITDYVTNNYDKLDTLLLIQSELIEYNYNIDYKSIRVYGLNDYKLINKDNTDIKRSEYLTDEMKTDILFLFDEMNNYSFITSSKNGLDYRFITISPSAINICFMEKNSIAVYLRNYRDEYVGNSSYSESIDDTWTVVLMYLPKG